jgi:hypothetical protein
MRFSYEVSTILPCAPSVPWHRTHRSFKMGWISSRKLTGFGPFWPQHKRRQAGSSMASVRTVNLLEWGTILFIISLCVSVMTTSIAEFSSARNIHCQSPKTPSARSRSRTCSRLLQVLPFLKPRENPPRTTSATANTHPLTKKVIVPVRSKIASITQIPKKRIPAVFLFMSPRLVLS